MPATMTNQTVCENCATIITGACPFINPLGEYYCQRCKAEKCFVCASCNSYAFVHDRVLVGTGSRCRSKALCPSCAHRETVSCQRCDTIVFESAAFVTSGSYVCRECYDAYYVDCEGCGRSVHTEDTVEGEYGDHYCPTCGEYGVNFNPGHFTNVRGFSEVGSRRCYGIELETASCTGYVEELKESDAWGAKDDCTVTGKEFFSDILSGDSGLDAIRELTDIASANNWTVDHNAGFHLHLDMRGETEDALWAIAYAYRRTQDVWLSFVEADRHDGEYCHGILWNCSDLEHSKRIDNYDRMAYDTDRNNWANLSAYRAFTTIEIRLHHGTLDADDIVNWVKAHTRFADWASKLGYEGVRKALNDLTDDELFAFIAQEVWDDSDLTIYYGKRAQMYRHGYLTKSIGK